MCDTINRANEAIRRRPTREDGKMTWYPGKTVEIYEDPITETKLEGTAVLKSLLDADRGTFNGRVLQRWMVFFPGKYGGKFERMILTPEA